MPIKPENKHRYPRNWPAIRARIRARAGNCCERCGVRNHAWGWRDADGVFHPAGERVVGVMDDSWHERKCFRIVCTVAHLDHVPEHCADENLLFLCQRCHLAHDRLQHAQSRYMTLRARTQTLELPL